MGRLPACGLRWPALLRARRPAREPCGGAPIADSRGPLMRPATLRNGTERCRTAGPRTAGAVNWNAAPGRDGHRCSTRVRDDWCRPCREEPNTAESLRGKRARTGWRDLEAPTRGQKRRHEGRHGTCEEAVTARRTDWRGEGQQMSRERRCRASRKGRAGPTVLRPWCRAARCERCLPSLHDENEPLSFEWRPLTARISGERSESAACRG
jgi:hypothetical protein